MESQTLTITVLGSGTSTGVPVIGCSCAVCTSESPKNKRTRCSALISYQGKNILIDTSTDLRCQALREQITRIDAVFYTHTHADHVHGIDDLRPFNMRAGKPIPLYGSSHSLKIIRKKFDYIFNDDLNPGYCPNLVAREIDGPFNLLGLPVIPLPLFHGKSLSLGYRIGPFAYLTDCSAIPEKTENCLQNLDLLIVDALRFRPHATHFNIPQALEVAARLKPRRTLLTHLSHDVDHIKHSLELPAAVELAFDGQRISLDLRA